MNDEQLKVATERLKDQGMIDPVIVHVLPALGGWVVCAEGHDVYSRPIRLWIEVVA